MNKMTVKETPEARALVLATNEVKRQKGLVRLWKRVSVCMAILMLLVTVLNGFMLGRETDESTDQKNAVQEIYLFGESDRIMQNVCITPGITYRRYGRRRERASP